MNKNKNSKLLNVLFPTPEIRHFFCNDLFVEFDKQISTSSCISSYNRINKVRSTNFQIIKLQIENILKENNEYLEKVKRLFFYVEIDDLIDYIIASYVFYIAITNKKFSEIDVFNDKRSICFNFFN